MAAYLLVPDLLWVSFAVGLNFRIWQSNDGAPSS
jgi:tryptophan-rich sensory protein